MVWLWRLCTNFAHPIPKIDFSSPETMDGFRTELGRHRIIAPPKKEQARRVGNLEITRKTSSEPCWKYVSASFLETLSIKPIKHRQFEACQWAYHGIIYGIPLFGMDNDPPWCFFLPSARCAMPRMGAETQPSEVEVQRAWLDQQRCARWTLPNKHDDGKSNENQSFIVL